MIPDCRASERLCVAKMTPQLALRRTFSHSRILERKTGCPQHDPGFIQYEKGRLTVQRFLDPVENVEQDRDQVAISLFHQLFHFKDRERGLTQIVRPGVQKHPHRPRCV